MAGKAKAEGTVTAAERCVISSSFDKETFTKIESLAKADERSLSQWLVRFVREQLKDTAVPKLDNLTELKQHA